MFQFPAEIRRAIYTTNVIESLNYSLRKITKTVPRFQPKKLPLNFYGSVCGILRKMGPCRFRTGVRHESMAIIFEGRLPIAGLSENPITQNS
jgi:hypothetical protein